MQKQRIETFMQTEAFAVVGASVNRAKYGNKVLRCYMQHGKKVYPVNPSEKMVEGLPAVSSVFDLSDAVESISIITPPAVTEKIVNDAIKKGIRNIWMQPGAESKTAINECLEHGINLIANGPCILVYLGFSE